MIRFLVIYNFGVPEKSEVRSFRIIREKNTHELLCADEATGRARVIGKHEGYGTRESALEALADLVEQDINLTISRVAMMQNFVDGLKLKAGLPAVPHWSEKVTA